MLADENFWKNTQGKRDTHANEENNQHGAKSVVVLASDVERAHQRIRKTKNAYNNDRTQHHIRVENCAQYTTEFLPFLVHRKFRYAFFSRETKTEIQQNSVSKNTPKQRPESELFLAQILKQHAEHQQTEHDLQTPLSRNWKSNCAKGFYELPRSSWGVLMFMRLVVVLAGLLFPFAGASDALGHFLRELSHLWLGQNRVVIAGITYVSILSANPRQP